MRKDEVYSWRVSSSLKAALEDAARRHGITASELLERAVRAWLATSAATADDDEQRLLHARARTAIGTIAGPDRSRSERVRELVRARLGSRHAR